MSTAKEQEIDMTQQAKDESIELNNTVEDNEVENKTDENNNIENREKSDKAMLEKGRKKDKGSFLKELLIYVCIFLVLWKVVPAYIIERTVVDGTSMQNTLQDEEQLMVEKLSYRFSDPKRFDIVVLMPYGEDVDEYFIKRVIGLPGETIQIKDGKIYINGEVLEENYGKESIIDGGIAKEPLTLGEDEYFVMGDNRNGSDDSRADYIGPIARKLIKGKAILRVWPIDHFGSID